eukprot:899980-Amorphochlora_amoeboformis.AAC.1
MCIRDSCNTVCPLPLPDLSHNDKRSDEKKDDKNLSASHSVSPLAHSRNLCSLALSHHLFSRSLALSLSHSFTRSVQKLFRTLFSRTLALSLSHLALSFSPRSVVFSLLSRSLALSTICSLALSLSRSLVLSLSHSVLSDLPHDDERCDEKREKHGGRGERYDEDAGAKRELN